MAKPGPVPKGDREPFTARYPTDHLAIYKARAVAAGLPVGDYLAAMLASAHGLEEPSYLHRNPNQPTLLTGT